VVGAAHRGERLGGFGTDPVECVVGIGGFLPDLVESEATMRPST